MRATVLADSPVAEAMARCGRPWPRRSKTVSCCSGLTAIGQPGRWPRFRAASSSLLTQRFPRGERPLGFDKFAYKARNVVESSFALAKQWLGLATGYDKLALTYRVALVLVACMTRTNT